MNNSYKWLVLDKINWGNQYPQVNLSMGIELAPVGKILTACGKGYWECESGEPEELVLEHPGINYFRFSSASSIFSWQKKQNEFAKTWITD